MKSPVKQRIMKVLLDGQPHSESELVHSAGFTRFATIEKWVRLFVNAGFIEPVPAGPGRERFYQLRISRDSIRKIYNYPEFRSLRPQVRESPWFCILFTENFSVLSGDLPATIGAMVRKSHTFFVIIDRYDSPEKIREVYHPCLYPFGLQGYSDPEFESWCLYYLIYVQSVVQDISGGGLSEGFMDVMRSAREGIASHAPGPGVKGVAGAR